MKHPGKLLITVILCTTLVALVVAWLSLPWIATRIATAQFENQGFTVDALHIDHIGLHGADVRQLSLHNASMALRMENIQAFYRLEDLVRGEIDRISSEKISITSKAETGEPAGIRLDPVWLTGILVTRWHSYVPVRDIRIDNLHFSDAAGNTLQMSAIDVRRRDQQLEADIQIRPTGLSPQRFSLKQSPETGIEARLSLQDNPDAAPFQLSLSPGETAGMLKGQLFTDLAYLHSIRPLADRLAGKLHAEISLMRNRDDNSTYFHVSLDITQAAINDISTAAVHLAASGSLQQQEAGATVLLEPGAIISASEITQGTLYIDHGKLSLPGSILMQDGRLPQKGLTGAELQLQQIVQGTTKIPEARLRKLDVKVTADPGMASDDYHIRIHGQLEMPQVRNNDILITLSDSSLVGRSSAAPYDRWQAELDTELVIVESSDALIRFDSCRSSMLIGPVKIKANTACTYGPASSAVTANFNFDPQIERGNANINIANYSPNSESPWPGRLVKNWSVPFDLVSGDISTSGKYRWWAEPETAVEHEELTVELQVRNAGGHYENIFFSGLAFTTELAVLPLRRSTSPFTLNIDNIDIGVPLTKLQATISLYPPVQGELPVTQIENLKMSLFDGEIASKKLTIDPAQADNRLEFDVAGLDLAQIIDLQQVEGLSASGRLDGHVPVKIAADGIHIENGKLTARAPGGHIRYQPGSGTSDMEQAAPGTEFVFRILENLDYHTLDATANYQPDGQLLLNLALQGKSPKVDDRRPVHINLNLEQNVLKLLQSLRYVDGLNDALDRNVQQYFNSNKAN